MSKNLSLFAVVDAAGKPSSDLLDFNLRWIGNYEECTAIEAVVYEDTINKTGPSNPFDGKYCLTYFPIGNEQVLIWPWYELCIHSSGIRSSRE